MYSSSLLRKTQIPLGFFFKYRKLDMELNMDLNPPKPLSFIVELLGFFSKKNLFSIREQHMKNSRSLKQSNISLKKYYTERAWIIGEKVQGESLSVCKQKTACNIISNGPIPLVWVTHKQFELDRCIRNIFNVKQQDTTTCTPHAILSVAQFSLHTANILSCTQDLHSKMNL